MATDRAPNPTQISSLPGVTRHITGHNAEGKAIIESSTPGEWKNLLDNAVAFDVVYTTTQFPVSLTDNADITAHEANISNPERPLGLVQPGGTVCRIVDFAPGTPELMHRTQSLDYGVVLEGEVEMVLDDGVKTVMRRGDVAVQRATNHGWRNVSDTQWARMLFVLQECKMLVVAGKEMGEDLDHAKSKEGLTSQTGKL